MLVRAVRASWACLGSALGRSDVPAVPRGRSGRSAQRPHPCTRPPLGSRVVAPQKKPQSWPAEQKKRQNVTPTATYWRNKLPTWLEL